MTDDSDTLESIAVKEIESAVYRKVFFVVLAGAIAVGSWVGLGGVRPDPFTGTDGDELKAEMEKFVKRVCPHQRPRLKSGRWNPLREGWTLSFRLYMKGGD